MTRYIADYASYQGALTAADFHRAEFQVINFKVSHGLGTKAVHSRIATEIASARRLGMGIGTFHWLTGDASGTAQADHAFGRLRALGLTAATMHTVDVEEQGTPPSYAHVRDYVLRMEALLGRPVALYTGDWWWTAPGRRWDGRKLTPYLMAAPNSGYTKDKRYPGDTSGQWGAGYGGWPNLSIMQYAVDTLAYPDGGRSTAEVSKAAMRDDAPWRALTGGGTVARAWTLIPCLAELREEFNAVAPRRDKGADGSIGDSAHTSSSDHTPDEISSVLRDHDGDDKNEVHALDIDSDGPWPDGSGRAAGGWFDRKVKALIAEERRRWLDPNDKCRLEYVIWRRTIYSRNRDFAPVAYSGAAHEDHAHFSGRYLTATESDTRPWGVKTESAPTKPAPEQEELPVESAEFNKLMDAWVKTPNGRSAFTAWMSHDPGVDAKGNILQGGIPNPDTANAKANPTLAPTTAFRDAVATRREVAALARRVDTMDAKLDEIRAAVTRPAPPTTEPSA